MKSFAGRLAASYLLRGPKVFYASGMRRSGNHALIGWLANALEGRPTRLVVDPEFVHFSLSDSRETVLLNEVNMVPGREYFEMLRRRSGPLKHSKFLIVSTEDCRADYRSFRVPRFDLGLHTRRTILNLIASRLQNLQKKAAEGIGWARQTVDRQFFETLLSWRRTDFTIWEYDRWIGSAEYRAELLAVLGLDTDILPEISAYGGGSSFGPGELAPTAAEARNRYQQVDLPRPVLDLLLEDKYRALLTPWELEWLLAR